MDRLKIGRAARAPTLKSPDFRAALQEAGYSPEFNPSGQKAWYHTRITNLQKKIILLSERQNTNLYEVSNYARKERKIRKEFVREMIPFVTRALLDELKLHRMEILKTLYASNRDMLDRPPNEARRLAGKTENLIKSYRAIEEETIRILNDHAKIRKKTIEIIRNARRRR